jgi:hypothetical protein
MIGYNINFIEKRSKNRNGSLNQGLIVKSDEGFILAKAGTFSSREDDAVHISPFRCPRYFIGVGGEIISSLALPSLQPYPPKTDLG